MIQDFKFALRQLRKAPGFTVIAVLTLSLAIGVNSAIFALINSVVLRPMVPLRPQEVVNVFNCRQNANHDYRSFSYQEYRELRENSPDLFADLAALGVRGGRYRSRSRDAAQLRVPDVGKLFLADGRTAISRAVL